MSCFQKSPCLTCLPIIALAAAWLFATLPNFDSVLLVTWLASARTFSHQQKLSSDVARILTGHNGELVSQAKALALKTEKSSKPKLPVPPETGTKQTELKAEAGGINVAVPEMAEHVSP